MFQIRNVNGAMPFPEDRGWKDTVWVDGQVELLCLFRSAFLGALPVLLQQSDAGNGGPWLDWATVGQSGTVVSSYSPEEGEYGIPFDFSFVPAYNPRPLIIFLSFLEAK